MFSLDGKVALVTGGGRGIGSGICEVFAEAGAKVMVVTRTAKYGEETVDLIRSQGGTASLFVTDIGNQQGVSAAIDATVDLWGGLDIVVHNAASFLGAPVDEFVESDFDSVIDVNLKAGFRLAHAAIPLMRKRGAGRILFTSSVTGPRVSMPGSAYYAASKSGVNGFIRTAALELGRENITVNGVEPGFIRTAAMELLADEAGMAEMARYIPAGYLGDPKDIGYAMLYLASDEGRYVTGQTIVVDGGSTLPESPGFVDQIEGVSGLGG